MAGSALLSQLQSWFCDFVYGNQSCLSHNEATMDSTGVEKAQIVYCSIAHERSIRDDMQLNTFTEMKSLDFRRLSTYDFTDGRSSSQRDHCIFSGS